MLTLEGINWLAVLAGGFIYFFVGALWYSPLIAGKAWVAEMNLTPEDLNGTDPKPMMLKSFLAAIVLSAGLALTLNIGSLQLAGWKDGLILGAFLSVFIAGAGTVPNYVYESRTVRHFLIHSGNLTVSMMAIGALIAEWR